MKPWSKCLISLNIFAVQGMIKVKWILSMYELHEQKRGSIEIVSRKIKRIISRYCFVFNIWSVYNKGLKCFAKELIQKLEEVAKQAIEIRTTI